MELPNDGMNRTSTLDMVSPTTTLYEIIAEEIVEKSKINIDLIFGIRFLYTFILQT